MKQKIQRNLTYIFLYSGFYEDFYRVVVQNERFEDWSPTVRELKRIFTNYKRYVLDYHKVINLHLRIQLTDYGVLRLNFCDQPQNYLSNYNLNML